MFLKNKKNKFFTVWQAIRKTLIYCMKKDKNIILFGEGIDDGAAMFQTTKGFLKIFGAKRVFEMPLSENLFIGAAVGASMLGDKVIVNLQRVEFALLALEQIINNAAKTHYLSNGSLNIPIVIRLVIGRGWGQGPTHSQSLETLFTSIPGLKVMMPVFPEESKNLLFEAIRDPNPVIFIENRWCHYNFGKLNKKYKSKNSSVIKLSEGNDLIIFTTGYNTNETVEILKMLKKYRINISHFHFGILKPLKIRNLIPKIKKIKKIILLDSGLKEFGFFSEVVSQIYENIEGKEIRHIRIGLPDHPIPSSKSLTKNVYLTGDIILKNIFKMLKLKITKQKIIMEDYKNLIKNKIIDTPNNNFKGPF
jgi:pyruvate dehydrogenase E1 component beta subunit